jgi:hypothetical protein
MRSLFITPANALWLRDGIIDMLAGNLCSILPTLFFKATFHVLSAPRRRGLKQELSGKAPWLSAT